MSKAEEVQAAVPKNRIKQRGYLRLGSVAGIEVGIHYTWLLAFALITWSLAAGFFPNDYPDWSTTTYWLAGAISAVMLFVSVFIHEMSHSLVARKRGMPVNSIVLFIFGGASQIEEEPENAKDEFLMAFVGPLTSLGLAALFWTTSRFLADGSTPLEGIITYLALINLLLGAFNLLPGLPLDGGRILRSIVLKITGDMRKATNVAALAGRGLAWIMIGVGVFLLLGGNFLGGLWIAFIGWFLNNAAETSKQQITLREQLKGVIVADVMEKEPCMVSPDTSVGELVQGFLRDGRRSAAVCSDGDLQGVVTLSDVKEIDQGDWEGKRVRDIMTSEPLYIIRPGDELTDAMKVLAQNDVNQLPVVEDGKVRGMLTRANLIGFIQVSQELDLKPGRRSIPQEAEQTR